MEFFFLHEATGIINDTYHYLSKFKKGFICLELKITVNKNLNTTKRHSIFAAIKRHNGATQLHFQETKS